MSITFSIRPHKYFYRPQTKLREGYIFTRVCDSVHRVGCLPQSPQADTPPRQTPLPPWADTPPPSACWDTPPLPSACWAVNKRYASYWNAFLSIVKLQLVKDKLNSWTLFNTLNTVHYNDADEYVTHSPFVLWIHIPMYVKAIDL